MTLRECSGIGRAATRSEPSGVAGGVVVIAAVRIVLGVSWGGE